MNPEQTMTSPTPMQRPAAAPDAPHPQHRGNDYAAPAHTAGGHDEIPKDLPKIGTGKIMIVAVVGVAILAGLFVLGYVPRRNRIAEANKVAQEQSEKPIVEVQLPKRVTTGGNLVLPADARAMQETPIYPRANGYLKRLLVDIGDHVKAGDLLAEIDTPEVDAQLNEAKAALEQARANMTKSKADLALAQSTLNRYETLAKSDGGLAVTQQDLDEKRAAFNQSQSAANAAGANVTAAEAAVQRLITLQGFEKVTAPFNGVVSARNYDVGALISPANTAAGSELFRLTRADTLRVFVNVPQSAASAVKIGQPATLEVRNFAGKKFAGKVVRTSGAIDPNTRTLRMEIDIPNSDYTLWAGMYGQVTLPILADNPPLIVPTSAMMFAQDGTKVALVDAGGKIRMQKITVGRDLGQELEVTEGLSGDDKVVTNPGERLADGVEVQVAQPGKKDAVQPKTETAQR
jgi:RND family efflux transporter MFP subunit